MKQIRQELKHIESNNRKQSCLGKYFGWPWHRVPDAYLQWLVDNYMATKELKDNPSGSEVRALALKEYLPKML